MCTYRCAREGRSRAGAARAVARAARARGRSGSRAACRSGSHSVTEHIAPLVPRAQLSKIAKKEVSMRFFFNAFLTGGVKTFISFLNRQGKQWVSVISAILLLSWRDIVRSAGERQVSVGALTR